MLLHRTVTAGDGYAFHMSISTMPFGRSGHSSTRVIFGAAALSRVTQDVADEALDVLLRYDVNHIDVAASYGDAELRVKPWLRSHPGRFFVGTKTGQRTAAGAREELHRSLDRLGVDHVDLWQLHNLSDPIEWDVALSPGGAGNYLTLRLPYYRENFDALVETCRERRVAVQTIKSIALRHWMGRERTTSTWYQPLEAPADIDRAVWWVLGRPDVFLVSTGDVSLLPRVLDAAGRFERATPDAEMEELAERAGAQPLFV